MGQLLRNRLTGFDAIRAIIHDKKVLDERAAARHHERPDFKNAEPMTEREFVRKFGDKVKKVRYSGRTDFVGLEVLGKNIGFLVRRHPSGERRVYALDIDSKGHVHVTNRYIRAKDKDSISNLWRGLLNYVQ